MENRLIPLLVMMLTTCLVGCQSGGGNSSASGGGGGDGGGDGDDPEFQPTMSKLVDQHIQGLLRKDTASLERLWSDDFTFINPRGELLSKANRLENVRTGSTSFKSIDASEQRHRSIGRDAAVTTNLVRIQGQYSGQEGSGDYRVTWVWSRLGGRWQLVALQMTRVGQS